MSGNKAGGLKAKEAILNKYGENYFANIGAIGGRRGRTGGFASDIVCKCKLIYGDHFNRFCAGRKGGTISRRNKTGDTMLRPEGYNE